MQYDFQSFVANNCAAGDEKYSVLQSECSVEIVDDL